MCRVAALGCAKNFVTGLILGRGRRGCRCGDDGAGEFGAGDPRKGWLVLIFAADLEQVEEICRGRMNGDEVFVWFGGRCGESRYSEVIGALQKYQYILRTGRYLTGSNVLH